MNDLVTVRQAFEAMRFFLAEFNEREPAERRDTIEQLLRWTVIDADGVTSDPAQWPDWKAAVTQVVGEVDSNAAPFQ